VIESVTVISVGVYARLFHLADNRAVGDDMVRAKRSTELFASFRGARSRFHQHRVGWRWRGALVEKASSASTSAPPSRGFGATRVDLRFLRAPLRD